MFLPIECEIKIWGLFVVFTCTQTARHVNICSSVLNFRDGGDGGGGNGDDGLQIPYTYMDLEMQFSF